MFLAAAFLLFSEHLQPIVLCLLRSSICGPVPVIFAIGGTLKFEFHE